MIPKLIMDALRGLTIPGLLRQLGAGKYLRERALHTPDALMGYATAAQVLEAARFAMIAGRNAPNSSDMWRAQESVQVMIAMGQFSDYITSKGIKL